MCGAHLTDTAGHWSRPPTLADWDWGQTQSRPRHGHIPTPLLWHQTHGVSSEMQMMQQPSSRIETKQPWVESFCRVSWETATLPSMWFFHDDSLHGRSDVFYNAVPVDDKIMAKKYAEIEIQVKSGRRKVIILFKSGALTRFGNLKTSTKRSADIYFLRASEWWWCGLFIGNSFSEYNPECGDNDNQCCFISGFSW